MGRNTAKISEIANILQIKRSLTGKVGGLYIDNGENIETKLGIIHEKLK